MSIRTSDVPECAPIFAQSYASCRRSALQFLALSVRQGHEQGQQDGYIRDVSRQGSYLQRSRRPMLVRSAVPSSWQQKKSEASSLHQLAWPLMRSSSSRAASFAELNAATGLPVGGLLPELNTGLCLLAPFARKLSARRRKGRHRVLRTAEVGFIECIDVDPEPGTPFMQADVCRSAEREDRARTDRVPSAAWAARSRRLTSYR